MGKMRGFLIGFIVGVLLLPVISWCYLYLGFAPVATAAPPIPLERTITSMALKARIAKEAPKDSPLPASEDNLMTGAKIYHLHCAGCHGMPAGETPHTAKGMFPRPPQLLHGRGVTNDPPGQTYWKVKNGIRLTGMPAYESTMTDQELWQVSLFLANANKLSPAVTAFLVKSAPPEPN
jgi:mono/diheme cytochrome c family protein